MKKIVETGVKNSIIRKPLSIFFWKNPMKEQIREKVKNTTDGTEHLFCNVKKNKIPNQKQLFSLVKHKLRGPSGIF